MILLCRRGVSVGLLWAIRNGWPISTSAAPVLLASFVLRDGAEGSSTANLPDLGIHATGLGLLRPLFYGLKANVSPRNAGSRLRVCHESGCHTSEPGQDAGVRQSAQMNKSEVFRLYTSVNHRLIGQEIRFTFLADLFKWSFLQHRPTMFSVGDVLITAGVAYHLPRSLDGFARFAMMVEWARRNRRNPSIAERDACWPSSETFSTQTIERFPKIRLSGGRAGLEMETKLLSDADLSAKTPY